MGVRPAGNSGWPNVLRWSPARGCEDPTAAMVRAAGMAEASQVGKGVTNGDFWADSVESDMSCHGPAQSQQRNLEQMRYPWTRRVV